MTSEKEYSSSTRTLKVLLAILESPNRYTNSDFQNLHNVSKDTIRRDIDAMKTAGFDIIPNKSNRFALAMDKKFDKLRELLFFSEREENMILDGLRTLNRDKNETEKLMRKMSRIYYVSKNLMDKNYLTKLDRLEQAKREEKVVVLKNYPSSNSSNVSDRHVEVYEISPDEDIIHAFDINKKAVRHFRISRVTKLEITDKPWAYVGHHIVQTTDIFRIHDNKQTRVNLRMGVGAYNALLESFPVARAYIKDAPDKPDQFDFECKVNSKFLGLTNFIMANYNSIISISEPYELIESVRSEAKKLLEKDF